MGGCCRYGFITPVFLVITIVANTLIVVVLSKRHMRTSTNAVLMAMALSDMFTLLFPAPWLFYMYTFGNHYKPLSPVSACFAWTAMNEVSQRREDEGTISGVSKMPGKAGTERFKLSQILVILSGFFCLLLFVFVFLLECRD